MNLFFVVHSHPRELIHLCFVFVDLSSFNSWPSHVPITSFVFKDRHWADFITLLKIQKPNVPTSSKTVMESCNNSSTKPTRPGEKLSNTFPWILRGKREEGKSRAMWNWLSTQGLQLCQHHILTAKCLCDCREQLLFHVGIRSYFSQTLPPF